jgi:predicted small secreted protein
MRRSRPLAVALVLGTALLLAACGTASSPACPPGVGRGLWDFSREKNGPADDAASRLLQNPNFGATPQAARDLVAGIVDRRLVAALKTITSEHSVCVETFKEGHYFEPGVPDGPRIPEGYGKAGGLPNTHYFGRAADVYRVDGKPVEGNATDSDVLDVGRVLAQIPARRRPDQIIGPSGWVASLGYGRERGWILARDQLELHEDHIHLGYLAKMGTRNTR